MISNKVCTFVGLSVHYSQKLLLCCQSWNLYLKLLYSICHWTYISWKSRKLKTFEDLGLKSRYFLLGTFIVNLGGYIASHLRHDIVKSVIWTPWLGTSKCDINFLNDNDVYYVSTNFIVKCTFSTLIKNEYFMCF